MKVLRFEGGKVIISGKEQVESGIKEYLEAVKQLKRWPGRKRLTVKEAAAGHAKLFASLVR